MHMAKEILSIGGNTFQFFTRNPRGGTAKPLDEADASAFRQFAPENGIQVILAHAPYTLNGCSADPGIREFAARTMADETTKEALTIPKLGAPEKLHFDDVKDNDWFHDSVYGVAEKGIMVGTAKNLFSPNANTTRAMMMTILARLDGVNTEGGATWYEKGLKWAMDNKVSDGTNPEMNITREQVVTMLYRFAKSPAATGELKFTDSDTVSSWALDAMKWAVANKIVEGMSNNMLKPQGLATRAQMAAILERYSKLGK